MQKHTLFSLIILFYSCLLFAQKDMPNPPSDFQTIPAGSYVIGMDTSNQKIVPNGYAPFNLKAYGLVNQFLQNQFPVKWAIRAGKNLNDIDFSAQAERVYPSAVAATMMNFRGGPFIVPDTTICGISTQNIIQSFGNNVCVYRLVNSELIDIRYTITNSPKVAIFTNGGNEDLHEDILIAAGISNYDFLDAAQISSLTSCYTLVSEPHWSYNDADSIVINGVKNFVISGGNFIAQCQALETYENFGFFATTNGVNVINRTMIHTYHNPDLPILQISGSVMQNQGGSVRNFAPKPGSSWQNTTYKVISHNGGDTVTSVGMHLASPSISGGNAFFLGSHNYFSLSDLNRVNALRMYLNAVFIPSINNSVWARAGTDQAMTCAGGAALGCAPTGPPGATYLWQPSSGLNCTTCENPVATPLSTTTYTVTVTNSSGCTSADNVLITTNLVYPVANFTSNTVCVNNATSFTNQSTNSPVQWKWDFGDGDTSIVQHPVHTYSNPGTYTVTLTATNSIGCTHSIQKSVTVNPNPVAGFSSTEPCFGNQTCFINASSVSSGTITSYSWNFGDPGSGVNNISSSQNPCHTYTTQSANATLTLTTNAGCQSAISLPVSFAPDPVSSFSSTVSCEEGTTCFTDLSTISSGTIAGWNWDFSDPSSGTNNNSTAQHPCHIYLNTANSSAQLTVTSDRGCQNTVAVPVSFHPLPVVTFGATTACYENATCFTNASTVSSGTISSHLWNFGDAGAGSADTSSLQNPCHIYSSSGMFNVNLTIVTDQGCQRTISNPVTVSPLPVIDFTPSWACLAVQTCFTNLSTVSSGTITNYNWNFNEPVSGTNDNSTLENPCYTFANLNPVDVTLILTTDMDCTDTLERNVIVSTVPVADFSSDVVCPGIMTCFTDLSTIPAGTITNWQWNFSDPASGPLDTSAMQNPCHTFIDPSSSNVSLTVTSDIGCQNTISKPVTFKPVPDVDFTITSACLGNQTLFSDISTVSTGVILSRSWNFGEAGSGLSNTSIAQNPNHTYSTADTFNVTLTIIGSNGCQSTLSKDAIVSPLPVANFSSSSACFGMQTCFTDMSTIPSGNISTYNWNFGDAASGAMNNSPQQNTCHVFSSLSPFTVSLILTSDQGCSDTSATTITVSPNPVANFSSTVVCPGDSTCFTDLSAISSGTIANWNWSFSDPSSGSNDSSVFQNPCHSFINTNSPNVSLTVTSNSGCEHTVYAPVTFHPEPVPDFLTSTACSGSQTCFTNLSSVSSGTIISHQWNFGETGSGSSNVSSSQNACHIYSSANTFDVSLLVTTDNGCQENILRPVEVSPVPLAQFSSSRTCQGDSTCFTDLSSITAGTISTYSWNFNDPGSASENNSSLQTPCHLFSTLNPYNVSLILVSDKGCSDTITSSVAVLPNPSANFNSTVVCPGNPSCFSDLSSISSGSITGWQWNFSDTAFGSTASSNSQNPCHTFINTISPDVTLTVSSDSGCQNTFIYPVSFSAIPLADFNASTSCLGMQTCFTDLSSITSGTITNMQWNFDETNSGASNSSTLQNPCHLYSSDGSFSVTLTLTSDNGCRDSTSKIVSVIPLPEADFSSSAVCINASTAFFDQSVYQNSDSILYWEWQFGDGSPAVYLQNPSHNYTSGSTYNVSLIASTISGCRDTVIKPVTVRANPVANFSFPQQGCVPVCESFSDLSSPGEGILTNWNWNLPGGNPSVSSQTNPQVCYESQGVFPATLVVTNSFGCMDTNYISQNAIVYPLPEADFYVIKEPESLYEPDLTLGHLWSNDVVKWFWDFGDNSAVDSINQDPTHTYSTVVMNNNYYNFNVTLDVQNQFGCVARMNREINLKPITTLYIPNTFSPNGDPANDLFFGKGLGIAEYQIFIFDRWGLLLWQCETSNDYREWDKNGGDGIPSACKWDGNFFGKPVQEDVYVWKVNGKNIFGESFHYIGHVNVVR